MDVRTWFYDDRTYYNYVLLNATREVYSKVQQALRSNGIKVLKAASSFRPASNGVQYKWYIRIEGENYKPPKSEQIKSIVESVLSPESQEDVAEKSRAVLQTKINSLNVEIEKLHRDIEQKTKEIENTKRLYELEIKNLQSTLSNTNSDLEQSTRTVNELRRQITDSFNLDYVVSLENQFKAQIEDLELKLQSAKQESKDRDDDFRSELNRRDIEIASLAQERDRCISELQSSQEQLTVEETGNSQALFFLAINVLLPNVEFLRSSLNFAWDNFSNSEIENVLQAIKLIDSPDMRAERVESANDWKEYHPKRVNWRIYFRQCKNKKYQVLISDKAAQKKRDEGWLKSQPKNC